MSNNLLCSSCFSDFGLSIEARKFGDADASICSNCNSSDGVKLQKEQLEQLAYGFFVIGSYSRSKFGGAPRIQMNEAHHGRSDISVPVNLKADAKLLEQAIGLGFFDYGPRFWMLGEVEPLKDLQNSLKRSSVIQRILNEYPIRIIGKSEKFFRLRINPKFPAQRAEYDSPPKKNRSARLGSEKVSLLYASQNLDVCIHESRASAEDDLYVATLSPVIDLKLLDLTKVLDEDVTEFESLDMAVHMLFLAGEHSYKICRAIAEAAFEAKFDGIIYPSYFSNLYHGLEPFNTVYGISVRRMHPDKKLIESQSIQNLALFGFPIADKRIKVECINKLFLRQIKHEFNLGPIKEI